MVIDVCTCLYITVHVEEEGNAVVFSNPPGFNIMLLEIMLLGCNKCCG